MCEALPVPVALTDCDGNIIFANKALSCRCDIDVSDLRNKTIGYLFRASDNDQPHELKHTRDFREHAISRDRTSTQHQDPLLTSILRLRNIRFDEPVFECELINCSMPVHVRVTEISGNFCFTIIESAKNQLPGSTVSEEHTKLKALNKELTDKLEEITQRNRQFARSNQDLSQYAYVASHDLQEPLRKIRIFSDILIGSPQSAGKDKFIATKINMASERMSLLIRDLLNYSKLLKSEAVFERVNLNEILKAVLVDFEVKIQEKKAVITFPDLPEIDAVKLQMNQLFYNLLGNALKFTLPDQAPVIEITAREVGGKEVAAFVSKPEPDSKYLHLTFADHGIGFESKDAEQIFEVFKRLYPREVYEGSGIGLALCRRIVQNHAGHLYADSAPGQGATFNIVVPVCQRS